MNKDKYILSIILAAVSGLGCLVLVLTDTFAPLIVLPQIDVPVFVAVSLLAVLIEYYFIKDKGERMWLINFLLAAACFGFFPALSASPPWPRPRDTPLWAPPASPPSPSPLTASASA